MVVSGVLVWAFDWTLADPILSVIIAVLILSSTWRLLGKVIHLLLQGTPEHIDVYRLCSEIEDVEGVVLVHDVHVWSLAQDYDVFTAHILIDPEVKDDRPHFLITPPAEHRLCMILAFTTSLFSWKILQMDVPNTTTLTTCTRTAGRKKNLTLMQRLKKSVRRQ